jgi:hypothetical protein
MIQIIEVDTEAEVREHLRLRTQGRVQDVPWCGVWSA